jgi:nuclear GTP-binding protein
LHSDKKQSSVGFIGYPNVGKSSVINTLRSKKVCNVAPLAGETKVWQYITLMKRIYLIDCPGVVHPTGDTDTDIILKGVIRVENVKEPEDHIEEVLNRVKKEYLAKTYKIDDWEDCADFMTKLARRTGKLLKGGEPDFSTVAKMMLNDWQRGKLPYFIKPPLKEGEDAKPIEETSKEALPTVKQDLTKLDAQITTEFEGDDNKDIEQETGDLYVSDDEGEDEADEKEDDDETEEVVEPTAGTSANGEEGNEEDVEQDEDDEESDSEDDFPQKKRRKPNESQAGPAKRLTSKQKRSLERQKRNQLIGTNFYDVVNVKNRNRNKKSVLDMSMAYRGHMKKATGKNKK